MANFLSPWIDVSTLTTGSFVTHDVSAYVPADATGVMLVCCNPGGSIEVIAIRAYGSTDANYANETNDVSFMRCVGLSSDKKFQTYQTYNTHKFYLTGYFTTDAVFFTNEKVYNTTVNSAWTVLDLSADLPATAVAVIGWHDPNGGFQFAGYRKNGSTDDRYVRMGPYYTGVIVGVDANRRIQYITNDYTTTQFCVVGYLTKGTFNTNAVDKSLAVTGSYQDINVSATLPANHKGVIIECRTSDSGGYANFLRMKGITTDLIADSVSRHTWWFVGTDVNGIFQGQIANTKTTYWLVGYFYKPPFIKPPFISFYPSPVG